MDDSGVKREKCVKCGRIVYVDRPACMYCGTERNIDSGARLALKKKIVEKALGKDEDAPQKKPFNAHAPIQIPSSPISRECLKCGEQVPQERNFCTSCGTDVRKESVAVPQQRPQPVQQPQPLPQTQPVQEAAAIQEPADEQPPPSILIKFKNKSSQQAIDFSKPETLCWGISLLLALVCLFIPFGTEPSGQFQRRIPIPFFLVMLYFISFFLVYMSYRNVTLFENGKKAFRRLHTAVVILSVMTGGVVLKDDFSHALEIFALSIPPHLFAAAQLRKRGIESFWDISALITAITILIYTPYMYFVFLDNVEKFFSKPGFIVHCFSIAAFLTGSYFRLSTRKNAAQESADLSV